ncbi:HlyD family efflux transporter periplasmic adaptor subunit [Waterburya agarophytonicola K14]|uniref:HlyD family efflux transporter periplasmic adaptor subunit n=1 Tax=Waterburya agarophytonicola KI4 TaxID=2874699 RepID=A0A964BV26_9CYAN|nr:HlyD family efflux transporter periplasmic adaptor subunit [Waterburya agarophytonicola]MCC0178681.1 HlyD family efflux transporter periplasmic adaptor subunit [Waterburya agarophytonicola KI4]
MSSSNSNSNSPANLANQKKTEIRILIVDHQSLSSELIKSQLKPEPHIKIIGSVHTELATFEVIKNFLPSIVIIDFDVPEINGFALVKKIYDNFAEVKTIVFTHSNRLGKINQALSLGASGFLIKNSSTEEVKSVLNTVTSDRSDDTKLQLPIPSDPLELIENTPSQIYENNQNYESVEEVREFLDRVTSDKSKITDDTKLQAPLQSSPPQTVETAQSESVALITQNSAIVPAATAPLPAVIEEKEDWSAATKDLMDALPRVWTRGLLYCLIIGTGIIIPWSVLTKVDQTGTARGRLEPKDKVIQLDAPVGAKIKGINVKEGDKVKKGAILAELGSEIVNSELEQLKDKRSGLMERLSQLELRQDRARTAINTINEENNSRSLESDSQLAQAQQNLDTLKALYQSQKNEKLAQIEQVKQEINSSIAARKQAQLALAGSQARSKRLEAAYQEGVISQDRFLEIQQQAQENQELLIQANSAVEQSRSRLQEQQSSYENLIKNSDAEIKQAALRVDERRNSNQGGISSGKREILQAEEQLQELKTQIVAVDTELAQTNKQIESSQFELKQRQIVAPADGTVFHIAARGKGSVIQPGDRVIEIAPQDSTLILKAQIPPTDSGFLTKGMPVKIKFDAYPFQDYGVSDGELVSISPDSKVTDTPQGKQEIYELEVELDKPYILDGTKKIELTPGQTATAEVIIRQRRVIDFFLDPFRKLQEDGVKF